MRLARYIQFLKYRQKNIWLFIILLISLEAKTQGNQASFRPNLEVIGEEDHDSIYYEMFKSKLGSDKREAQHYALKSFLIAEKFHHTLRIIKAANALGYTYDKLNKFDSAQVYYRKAIQVASANSFTERLMYTYNNLGTLFERLDYYDSAIHYFSLSYSLAYQLKAYEDVAIAKNNIGFIYYLIENYKDAETNFKESIEISIKHRLSESINSRILNLAKVYNEQGFYQEALQQYNLIKANCTAGCSDNTLADLYYGLGHSHLKNNNSTDAYKYFQLSLKYANQSNSKQTLAYTYYHLSSFKIAQGNFIKAIDNLLEAEKIANQIGQRRLKRDVYGQLAVVYNQIKDLDKVVKYQDLYMLMKDSIFNETIANNLKNIQLGSERKESAQIIQKKDDQLKQSIVINILVGICCLLALAVIFIIFRSHQKSIYLKSKLEELVLKSTLQLKEKNEEVTYHKLDLDLFAMCAKEYLLGPLNTVAGLASIILRLDRDQQIECANRIEHSARDVKWVSKHLNELYRISEHEITLTEIDLPSFVNDLCEHFKSLKNFPIISVSVGHSVNQSLKTDKELFLFIVEHSIRYANATKELLSWELSIEQEEEQTVLTIDNPDHDFFYKLHRDNKIYFTLALMGAKKIDAVVGVFGDESHWKLKIYIENFTRKIPTPRWENIPKEFIE